ncbi:Mitotic checkpoint protein BUB3.3 [Morella rubra]|uniref:Mitotic checkpoint protein BUB3.3 n=1 Tax=Morella rubra TaxID=262757 RepID=A0A6A1V5M7_9ROSI|nr:Mitotic checkpoint protein BUB3.3 [Morella rubra]
MNGSCLEFGNPIRDAISRIEFAPKSNNLLISSWDSTLRLYDVDGSVLRLEAPSEAALLDCCFQNESVAFSAGSDGFVRRYDLHSGILDTIGNHDDIATSISYSNETCQVISAGFDKKIIFWDTREAKSVAYQRNIAAEVESMSLSGFNLMVAIGASIYVYDLRDLDKPVQSKDSHLDIRIRCVNSIPYSKGYVVGSVDGRVAVEIRYPSDPNDVRYMFRCHPKSKDGRYHLVSVNDIVFNPLICGAFVTGDNEGYVTAWDARSRRRLFELPRYANSVAALSYNHVGQLLAVASSYTYQEAKETEEPPQIFIHSIDDCYIRSVSAGSSSRN